ncbi:tRNA adenosine deaminase-associated protein [Acidothermus cellulolyticus]|uniref:tRNA adenosine deaminase-associated protein n=1 Tax=Acidothermus cellulolyticus TaxID=28049 RepID=UPI00030C5FF2|nr:tRNA adenosine deaminase-associated protein [Acidothermus cellulolyticus]
MERETTVSQLAALVAKDGHRWHGAEIDLGELRDIDDLADAMRLAARGDEPVFVFVEEDDEWFAVVRIDGGEEPRVFVSDVRMLAVSDIAERFFADLVVDTAETETDDAVAGARMRADAQPGGDTGILADFGISAKQLVAMCRREGQVPADVITEIADQLGCVDEIEVYR